MSTFCIFRMLAEGDGGISISWEADEEQDNGGSGNDRYHKKTGGGGKVTAPRLAAQQQQRLSFAPANSAALVETSAAGRHPYFRVRKLQRLTECF